jgi:hypothetical protein
LPVRVIPGREIACSAESGKPNVWPLLTGGMRKGEVQQECDFTLYFFISAVRENQMGKSVISEQLQMKALKFLFYYCKFRGEILLGFHRTAHPVSIQWRWQHWQDRQLRRHRRSSKTSL